MAISLRVLLVLASIFTFWYIARKLKKSQIQVMDTVFWLILSLGFIILAIFPQIAIGLAEVLGVQSPVNFVYLVMIFVLLIRCFLLAVRVSFLEDKVRKLVEEIALRENLDKEKVEKE